MSFNSAWDSLDFEKINLPYNKIEAKLSPEPRFVDGINAYVTLGGTLSKRPGTALIDNTNISGRRIDRLWIYETDESPSQVYLLASAYHTLLQNWVMYWINLDAAVPTWTLFNNLRGINQSTRAHEGVSSRGLFYIKGYPPSGISEKLGTVLFDGTGATPTVKFWGILPPTVPAALVGSVTRTGADINSSSTSLTISNVVGAGGVFLFPPAPFIIQVDYEEMLVTSIGTGHNWTVTRGYNGTVAEAHTSDAIVIWRDWQASTHQVDVNVSWTYTYAYKTSTGQVSNRAPIQTNTDKNPSSTGPFRDLIPKFVVQGTADTVNVPTIVMFRSTDGGGTFYELEEIPNTGAGSITYLDDSFESGVSGGIFNDPVPDAYLDQGTKAPTLTSNSPPPTVLAPLVVGVDTPAVSTPIAYYSGRLWYGIGNVVFYSGDEEISLGIPEECFPSGINGNFFRFQHQVVNVAATTSALYVFTLETVYEIVGTNKETFNPRPIFQNLGAPLGHPKSVTRYEETIIFLTQDYRIASIKDAQVDILSDPLDTDILDAINNGATIEIKYWGERDKEWVIVAANRADDTTECRQWVYDIKKSRVEQKPFWFVPWTIPMSSMAAGSDSREHSHSQRHLIFAMYNPASLGTACLTKLDLSIASDYFITAAIGYEFDVITNLFPVPPGNHVNKLRQPAITPVFYGVQLDRIVYPGDTDPDIYYYLDDLYTNPLSPTQTETPWRRNPSKGYKTIVFDTWEVCQHFAVEIHKISSIELFRCENLIMTLAPDAGA